MANHRSGRRRPVVWCHCQRWHSPGYAECVEWLDAGRELDAERPATLWRYDDSADDLDASETRMRASFNETGD
jgi:hypothetical protein